MSCAPASGRGRVGQRFRSCPRMRRSGTRSCRSPARVSRRSGTTPSSPSRAPTRKGYTRCASACGACARSSRSSGASCRRRDSDACAGRCAGWPDCSARCAISTSSSRSASSRSSGCGAPTSHCSACARRPIALREERRLVLREALRSRRHAHLMLELGHWVAVARRARSRRPGALGDPRPARRRLRGQRPRATRSQGAQARARRSRGSVRGAPRASHRGEEAALCQRVLQEPLPSKEASKDAKRYLRRLSRLQDLLGSVNDVDAAERLLQQLLDRCRPRARARLRARGRIHRGVRGAGAGAGAAQARRALGALRGDAGDSGCRRSEAARRAGRLPPPTLEVRDPPRRPLDRVAGLEQHARRVPGPFHQLHPHAVRDPGRACAPAREVTRPRRADRSSRAAPGRARPSPSASSADRAAASRTGSPRLVQLPKKISANDSPTKALKPQRISACGACSRDEPQPKLLPTTRIARPRITRVVEGVLALRGLARRPRRRGGRCPSKVTHLQEAGRDDAVGVDVVAAQHAGAALDGSMRTRTSSIFFWLMAPSMDAPSLGLSACGASERLAHVDDLAGDRRRRDHRRRHQQRAAGRRALAALEVAVATTRRRPRGRAACRGSSRGTSSSPARATRSRRRGRSRRALRPRPARAPPASPARRAPARPARPCRSARCVAASRRSEMRPLVHEPMKATSICVPAIGAPASKLHVLEASSTPRALVVGDAVRGRDRARRRRSPGPG